MFIRITTAMVVQIDDSTHEVRVETDPPAFEVRRASDHAPGCTVPALPGPGQCLTTDGDVINTPRLPDGRLDTAAYWREVDAHRKLRQTVTVQQRTAIASAAVEAARNAEAPRPSNYSRDILEALKWWGFTQTELEHWITRVGQDRVTRTVLYVQEQQQKPGGVTSPKGLCLSLLKKNVN